MVKNRPCAEAAGPGRGTAPAASVTYSSPPSPLHTHPTDLPICDLLPSLPAPTPPTHLPKHKLLLSLPSPGPPTHLPGRNLLAGLPHPLLPTPPLPTLFTPLPHTFLNTTSSPSYPLPPLPHTFLYAVSLSLPCTQLPTSSPLLPSRLSHTPSSTQSSCPCIVS